MIDLQVARNCLDCIVEFCMVAASALEPGKKGERMDGLRSERDWRRDQIVSATSVPR